MVAVVKPGHGGWQQPLYKAGDIGRVPPTDFIPRMGLKLMNIIFGPHCDFFHHFVIRTGIPDEDDYEIKESIASGVKAGRLSWYKNYEVYRLPNPEAVARGEMACAKFSRFGRATYDWLLFAKILAGTAKVEVGILWHEHHFRKIHASELPYAKDDHFVCTETAYEISFLMGEPILPWTVVSIPPAIQEAIDAGRLVKIVPRLNNLEE